MEKHLKLARAHQWLALFWLVAGSAGLIWSAQDGVDEDFFLLAAVFAIFLSLNLAAAVGARTKRPWARTLSKTMGSIMLLAVPIGTAIGGYLLLQLWEVDAPAELKRR